MKAAILAFAGLAGLLCLGWGALEYLAGMMSDAPQEGDDMGRKGCVTFAVGAVLIIAAIVGGLL